MHTADYEYAASLAALPTGKPVFVRLGRRELALVRLDDGTVHCLSNTCPHAGGNLAAGTVDGATLVCPVHAWRFDLPTGRCVDAPYRCVSCYPVRIVGDAVEVGAIPIPPPPLSAP